MIQNNSRINNKKVQDSIQSRDSINLSIFQFDTKSSAGEPKQISPHSHLNDHTLQPIIEEVENLMTINSTFQRRRESEIVKSKNSKEGIVKVNKKNELNLNKSIHKKSIERLQEGEVSKPKKKKSDIFKIANRQQKDDPVKAHKRIDSEITKLTSIDKQNDLPSSSSRKKEQQLDKKQEP